MKIAIAAIALVLLSAVGASAQNNPGWNPNSTLPTPTLEQCRADLVMWGTAKGIDATTNPLGYAELYSRGMTLQMCGMVALNQHGRGHMTYDDLEEYTHYLELSSTYVLALGVRFNHFVGRHNESQQFADEDAAGQR